MKSVDTFYDFRQIFHRTTFGESLTINT